MAQFQASLFSGSRARTLGRVVVASMATLLCLGCDAWYAFKGRVVDSQGQPVDQARIAFEHEGGSVKVLDTTDALGRFDVFESAAPMEYPVVLVAEADGYRPLTVPLLNSAALALHCVRIVLARPNGDSSRLVVVDSGSCATTGTCDLTSR